MKRFGVMLCIALITISASGQVTTSPSRTGVGIALTDAAVTGILPRTKGGTEISSAATFPTSGTVAITTDITGGSLAGSFTTLSASGTLTTNTGASVSQNIVLTPFSSLADIRASSAATIRLLNAAANTVLLQATDAGEITIPGTFALTGIASDATHTDATVCVDTTTKLLYSGSGALGVCLGTSSERYKMDITMLDVGLREVLALNPISYRLKRDPGKVLYGFSAEQGGQVLPQLMSRDAMGRPNSFDYVGVIPVLVAAIHEQQRQIDRLTQEVRSRVISARYQQ